MNAMGYLRRLQSEVGARRAGTPGDKMARSWLLGSFSGKGVQAEERLTRESVRIICALGL
jgi:hypothetical protein